LTATFFTALSGLPAQASQSCVAQAADEGAAKKLAKDCKLKVEVLSALTEQQRAFANPDGTTTLEIAAVPQRVRKGTEWKDIDTALYPGKDGRLYPKAAALVSFSNGGTEPFVIADVEGKTFALSWPTALPKPVVAGDTATYLDILPGVDLAVQATRTGYNHVLKVKTAEAAANPALAKVGYRVSGELKIRSTVSGTLELVDSKGKAQPFGSYGSTMWDSAADPALGGEVLAGVKHGDAPKSGVSGPSELAHVRQVATQAEGDILYVLPDMALLKTGTLPIYIDPPYEPWKSGWAYAHNNNANWTPGEHARVGRNPDDGTLFRSFFALPISGLHGKQVISAAMHINLDHSAACGGNTAYAYRTSGIGGANGTRVGWSPSLDVLLASAWGQSNEAGGCGTDQGDDLLIFGGSTFTNDVQAGANGSWGTYTVGLCMCSNSSGANESGTYQWMKFHHTTAKLVATYNTAPGTPADLTTSGVPCGGTVATYSPTIKGQLVDADGGERWHRSWFEWQELPAGGVNTITNASAPPGNYVSSTLNLGTGAEGKSYQWRLFSTDDLYPSWAYSGWCTFTVNASPPPLPGVSSANYPDNGTANGAPGVAGDFTFTNGGPTGNDVTKYVYGWTDPPAQEVTVNPGASVTVKLTPPRHGYNTLRVMAKEPSGIPGPTKVYSFLTGSPSAALAHWPLDSVAGHGLNDQVSGTPLGISGTFSWVPNEHYLNTDAFDLSADTGFGQSPVSTFDTSGSFGVSATVKLNAQSCTAGDTGNRTAVSVDADNAAAGNHVSGFLLSYNCADHKWRFRLPDTNTAVPGLLDTESAPMTAGGWMHVAGTWDEAERKLRLYVDGVLAQEVTAPDAYVSVRGAGWKAVGNVIIGRDRFNNTNGGSLKGEIGDVRLWNRVVVPDDIWGTRADSLAGTQGTPGIYAPVEVGTWDFADNDALDGSYWSRHMSVAGNATFTAPGHDTNEALVLDGTGDYAATSAPVIRSDQSFTVAAWVKIGQARALEDTVFYQGNASYDAFKLYRSGTSGKWEFGVSKPDGLGGYTWGTGVAWSDSAAVTGSWQHVAGVFDRNTGAVKIYVNGVLQAAQGSGAVGLDATSGLYVGYVGSGSNALLGQIDQVKAFQGAMSAADVAKLFNVQANVLPGTSQLAVSQRLNGGEYLRSNANNWVLYMQSDGNLVLKQGGVELWATGTWGNPGASLLMQTDGNLVIYTSAGAAIWDSATWGTAANVLSLNDDGNLVLNGPGGQYWHR
jgi:hypothetical protein